jgi:hypothetical protein
MALPHHWRECKPIMLSVAYEDPQPYSQAEVNEALQAVWAGLSNEYRLGFHQFCCENVQTKETIAIMSAFSRRLRRRLPELQ